MMQILSKTMFLASTALLVVVALSYSSNLLGFLEALLLAGLTIPVSVFSFTETDWFEPTQM